MSKKKNIIDEMDALWSEFKGKLETLVSDSVGDEKPTAPEGWTLCGKGEKNGLTPKGAVSKDLAMLMEGKWCFDGYCGHIPAYYYAVRNNTELSKHLGVDDGPKEEKPKAPEGWTLYGKGEKNGLTPNEADSEDLAVLIKNRWCFNNFGGWSTTNYYAVRNNTELSKYLGVDEGPLPEVYKWLDFPRKRYYPSHINKVLTEKYGDPDDMVSRKRMIEILGQEDFDGDSILKGHSNCSLSEATAAKVRAELAEEGVKL